MQGWRAITITGDPGRNLEAVECHGTEHQKGSQGDIDGVQRHCAIQRSDRLGR